MFRKLKSKLFKSLKSRKFNVFALFFLLSFFFWVLTKLSRTYTETIAFDLVFENIPEQHHIEQDSTRKVNVTINAYGFNLLRYVFYKPTLKINFETDVALKNNMYIWSAQQNIPKIGSKFINTVDVISVMPDTIRFNYQSLTVKKVPVKADVAIEFSPGFDMSSTIKVIPDSVKIIGSESRVLDIDFVTTEKVELKQVNSNIKRSVGIKIEDSLKHLKLSHKRVAIEGHVEKFTEGTLDVPVTIINLPSGTNINFFPKTIPVTYNVSLSNYKLVKVSDFRIECDYKNIENTGKTFFRPKLTKLPDSVKSARLRQKKVEFILM